MATHIFVRISDLKNKLNPSFTKWQHIPTSYTDIHSYQVKLKKEITSMNNETKNI